MSVNTASVGSSQTIFGSSRSKASVEDVLLGNLALLGMDIDGSEKKYGCCISRDMFHAPNVKAMEATLHFLLSKVSQEARDAFRVLWPILDKKQSRDFKTTAHKLLQRLEEDGHIPSGTVRLSHFQSASGERLQIMLWHLSIYVMKTVMENEKAPVPHLSSLWDFSTTVTGLPAPTATANLEAMKHVTQLKIQQQTAKFIDLASKMAKSEKEWQELASKLEVEYRSASQRSASIAKQTRDFEAHCSRHTRQSSTMSGEGAYKSNPHHIDENILSQVEEAWKSLARHIHNASNHQRKIIDSIIDKKANSTHFDAKHIKVETSAISSFGLVSSIEDNDGNLDLISMTRMWTGCLQELRHRLSSMTKSMQQPAKTGNAKLTSNKENKDNSDVLSEMASRLEQLSSQHAQYTSTVRSMIQNLRVSLPESHEFIVQLQQTISNSAAASAMASNLKQLLVDTTDCISSTASNMMTLPPSTPSTANRLLAKRSNSTPHKASSLALIPPTPRDALTSTHHRSVSSGIIPLGDTRRGLSTPSLGNSKQCSVITPLPGATPSRSADSSLRRNTLANAWMNEFDEGTLIAEINAGIISTALVPSEYPLASPAPQHTQHALGSGQPGRSSFSPNSSVHSTSGDDFLNTPTSSTRSNGVKSSAASTRRANRHSSPSVNANEVLRLSLPNNPTLAFDPSLGLSPLRLESVDTFASPSDTLKVNADSTLGRSISPTSFRHSMEDVSSVLSSSPWTRPPSSSTPASSASTPRGEVGGQNFSPSSSTETFIRFPSSKRNRASLDLDRVNTSMSSSSRAPLAVGLSPSPLAVASASPFNRATVANSRIQTASTSQVASPVTTISFQRASQAQQSAQEQQRMMDELAEQIVDIMGAATNISSADVARHTMALLGVKSPVVSKLSSASSSRSSPLITSPHHASAVSQQLTISSQTATSIPKRRHEKSHSGHDEASRKVSLHERHSSSPGPSNGFAQAMRYGNRHHMIGSDIPASLIEIDSQLASLDNSTMMNDSQQCEDQEDLSFNANTSLHILEASRYSAHSQVEDEMMMANLDGSVGFEPTSTSQSPPMARKRLSSMPFDNQGQPRINPFAPSTVNENDISVTLLESQLAQLASPNASRFSMNSSQILDSMDEQIMRESVFQTEFTENDAEDEDLELERELRRLEEEDRLARECAMEDQEEEAEDGLENEDLPEYEDQVLIETGVLESAELQSDFYEEQYEEQEEDDEFHDASAEFEDEEASNTMSGNGPTEATLEQDLLASDEMDYQASYESIHEEAALKEPNEEVDEEFSGKEVDSRLDSSLPSSSALEVASHGSLSSLLDLNTPSLLSTFKKSRTDEPKRDSVGELSQLQPSSAMQFSLEPYLFDYPTPSKAHSVTVTCEEPQLASIELDFEDDDLLAPITSFSSALSPRVSSSTRETDAHSLTSPIEQINDDLANDLEQLLKNSSTSKPTIVPRQRLNLSINPDDDPNTSATSPGFDRIKKVLDFGN